MTDGPDLTKPVPTPPHFGANCQVCNRRLQSENEPIFPGTKPWTFRCQDHATCCLEHGAADVDHRPAITADLQENCDTCQLAVTGLGNRHGYDDPEDCNA